MQNLTTTVSVIFRKKTSHARKNSETFDGGGIQHQIICESASKKTDAANKKPNSSCCFIC